MPVFCNSRLRPLVAPDFLCKMFLVCNRYEWRRGMTNDMNMRLNGMSGFSGMVFGGYVMRGISLR
ncbi:hypothetical protein FHL81_11280 [Agrobacterium tumefaciens]|nr:hypothetical protein FHL81_11280 [Agrobacterium tumefaciens]TGE80312.1 hypothetical protein C9410_08675 [Rhizobium sp. SEMIA 439]KAB0462104.1 hypothetical protein F7R04_00370 [Agrobacterium tumefaciens]MQB28097.1 hypothetical protein [Agrobacterium tumefaciens]OVE92534.1 hypothetical protein B7W89_09425 [Agrobacterium tumefaciens]